MNDRTKNWKIWLIIPVATAMIAAVMFSATLAMNAPLTLAEQPIFQISFGTGGISNPATITVNWQIYATQGQGSPLRTGTVTFTSPGPGGSVAIAQNEKMNYQFTSSVTDSAGIAYSFASVTPPTIQNPQSDVNVVASYTVSSTQTPTPAPSPSPTPVPAPVADFTADHLSGDAPLTIQLTDTSTGDVTSWLWDFGDGNTSTVRNSSHTFLNPGTFSVTLTVTGPGGSDTGALSVTVNEAPSASPSPSPSPSPGPVPTAAPTAVPLPTPTPGPGPTETPTAVPTPAPFEEPTATQQPTATLEIIDVPGSGNITTPVPVTTMTALTDVNCCGLLLLILLLMIVVVAYYYYSENKKKDKQ